MKVEDHEGVVPNRLFCWDV